jgi:hypothetical protein
MKERSLLLLFIIFSTLPFFSKAQYWSENFENYADINASLQYGYNWKNTFTYSGPKAIESRSLITSTIIPGSPAKFSTGYFFLEDKSFTVNFQHKTNAFHIKPVLTVYLIDENNTIAKEVFQFTYVSQAVQLSSFNLNGYTGWYKILFQFSSNDGREVVQCWLDNINSTIPINEETNSSIILADLQASIVMNNISPSIHELEISFTNLGPDPCFISPAGGTAVLSNLRNVSLNNYKTNNLDFDPSTGKIHFITRTAPDSFGVQQKATLRILLNQTSDLPVRITATITDLNFQRDNHLVNNTSKFYHDGGDIPLNWKKIELTTINNRDVHIYWETLIEVNANRYEVQRSEDGANFTAIGSVIATNNAAGNSYKYNDYALASGKDYYYRIRLLNQNGASIYSPVHRVSLQKSNSTATEIKVYPSILRPGSAVSAKVNENGQYEVLLLNSNMKALLWLESKSNNNKVNITLPSNMRTGVYYISFKNKTSNESITRPIIVND